MAESSGEGQVTVVEPGSEDDPFTKANAEKEEVAGPDATEKKDDTTSQPKSDDEEASKEGDEESLTKLQSFMDEQFGERMKRVQSGWDTRNRTLDAKVASLEKDLQTARREAEVSGMTDEERAVFQPKWDLEDAQKQLRTKTEAVDDYRKVVTVYDLTTRYGEFGVTEELLGGCDTPEEMETLAHKTRGDFLLTGRKPSTGKKAPAGASQKSDVGGGPAPKEEFKLGEEQGVQAMADNVSRIFKEPGNVK